LTWAKIKVMKIKCLFGTQLLIIPHHFLCFLPSAENLDDAMPASFNSLAHAPRLSNPAKRLMSVCAWLLVFAGVSIAGEKAAVFDFEIIRSNVIAGVPENRVAEAKRLVMIGARLRGQLRGSGKFELVDISPVGAKAAASNLQSCGGCADDFARELGAAYSVTGTVQKVSELILNINVYVHDAATSKVVTAATVDLRGNTDESWRRGIDYLYKNVLAPRLMKLKR
jgi:Protein of unknown function (DUF2380)